MHIPALGTLRPGLGINNLFFFFFFLPYYSYQILITRVRVRV